jgi:hypothetical protein
MLALLSVNEFYLIDKVCVCLPLINSCSPVDTSECIRHRYSRYSLHHSSMAPLAGRVVLVTGASAGIGAATAQHFASLGCRCRAGEGRRLPRLALVARSLGALQEVAAACREAGAGEVQVQARDLAVEEECINAVGQTIAHFGGELRLLYICCLRPSELHVLVNNAGILVTSDFASVTMEEVDRSMQVQDISFRHILTSFQDKPEVGPEAEPGEPASPRRHPGQHRQRLQRGRTQVSPWLCLSRLPGPTPAPWHTSSPRRPWTS